MLDRFMGGRGETPVMQTLEARVFKEAGFEIVVLDRKDLRRIPENPRVICMDDREPQIGIKLPGGTSFEASFRTGGTRDGLIRASLNEREKGWTPTVHGDDHHSELGCLWNQTWAQGGLKNVMPLTIDLKGVRYAVLGSGGEYDTLTGPHAADMLVLNTTKDTTTRPGLLAVECPIMREIAGDKYEQALGALAQVATGLKINHVGIIR